MASTMAGVPASNFCGHLVPLGAVHRDPDDHVAPGQERRHGLQQLAAAPQGADAGRAEHLVAADGQEVAADGLDVDGHVRRGLRGVDQDQGAGGVGPLGDLREWG